MADRINAYQLMRQVHMYSAFVTMTFLIMYFVTGYLMNNWQWFNQDKAAAELKTIPLSKPLPEEKEVLQKYLQDNYDIKGRFNNSWTNKGITYYEYQSVQAQSIVYFDSSYTQATIKISPKHALGSVTSYHRMHKYGGSPAYLLYILMMDLASLALLVFVVTGVYMWLKLARYRWLGIGFLTAGFAYSIWVWLSFIFY